MATQPSTARGPRSPVASLRKLMPDRALTLDEAKAIAELQASRLLATLPYGGFAVPSSFIEELPWIRVERVLTMIGRRSGMTHWSRSKGVWRVQLNAAESRTRQRFTLAHELKHILDAPYEDVIYRDLRSGAEREVWIEAICDHFAGCLLMPKRWVKRAFFGGTQDPAELAWRFDVSPQAMVLRLTLLGLIQPAARCEGVTLVRQNRRPPRTYFRDIRTSGLVTQAIGAAA